MRSLDSPPLCVRHLRGYGDARELRRIAAADFRLARRDATKRRDRKGVQHMGGRILNAGGAELPS